MTQKEFEKGTKMSLANNAVDIKEIDYHLSACYLLQSMAQMHLDFANSILKKYGLLAWDLKHHANAIDSAFDKYYKTMNRNITDANRELFTDDLMKIYDEIEKLLR